MPWLQKDEVLFIHVPRCGGTSITKFHKVEEKAVEGKNIFQKIGITYYYYRYKLLETANFPFVSWENLIALVEALMATFLFIYHPNFLPLPYFMWCTATTLFLTSSFLWTAPILMRIGWLRNFLMVFLGRVLCGVAADSDYLIGTNENGYLFHLTAERTIRYGYVSEDDVRNKSFSIVRNPYSRAVSMYEYNKRAFESFEHFIADFHSRCMERYYEKGQTDSSQIYCHVLPMYAYTHWNGEQLVGNIIKQEELKHLVSTNWEHSNIPKNIQKALTGIPHANGRKKKSKWQDYYTQETMNLVLEMYEKDFDIFGYDKSIPGRDDLIVHKKTCFEEGGPEESLSLKLSLQSQSQQTSSMSSWSSEENYYYYNRRRESQERLKKSSQSQMLAIV